MTHPSEFFKIYIVFQALVKTLHYVVIKCFRCDLGGEYTSNKFCQLLALDRTNHQTSHTDTTVHNGIAERKHRHIIETACSLLLSASVPNEFWGEEFLVVLFLLFVLI
jgi:hypothetical protein